VVDLDSPLYCRFVRGQIIDSKDLVDTDAILATSTTDKQTATIAENKTSLHVDVDFETFNACGLRELFF